MTFFILAQTQIKVMPINLTEVLKVFISILGGVITTYLMNYMKARFDSNSNKDVIMKQAEMLCKQRDIINDYEKQFNTIRQLEKENALKTK
jgi:hypothetical protein